ncbi:alpha/beta hydrolase [Patescibacteria group bacterium]|nr:alpha/beta hydrolase [Patescibacteria group bacterium]
MAARTPLFVSTDLEHSQIETNGIRLHIVQSGPANGPPVILLHGFPEFWYGWRHQIGPLAAAGYRLLVPDQRGYNRSQKPEGVAAYRAGVLVGDLFGLMQTLDIQRASLVGHDWGAAVAWWAASAHPERFDRLVILNVPHPKVMARTLRTSWRQQLRSWYIAFFQTPWLPEALLWAGDFAVMKSALQRSGLRHTFSAEELAVYQQAWAQPGALTGMLNWYRAAARHPARISLKRKIQVPTLMIWGARDVALGWEMAQPSIEMCEDGRLVTFETAGHWVQHEQAAQVNRLLLDFLSGTGEGKK